MEAKTKKLERKEKKRLKITAVVGRELELTEKQNVSMFCGAVTPKLNIGFSVNVCALVWK